MKKDVNHLSVPKIFFYFIFIHLLFTACKRDSGEVARIVEDRHTTTPFDPANYTADSIRMWELWEKYCKDDDDSKFADALKSCKELIIVGKRLMAQRFDSTLYEKYAKAYGGVGWNMMMLGYYDEALENSKLGYKLITEKFGENHIRNTQICVGISHNYAMRGDYDQAIEYILKGTSIMLNIFPPNHTYFGNNYDNLSITYLKKGDFEKAKYYAKKALANRLALPRNKYLVPIAYCKLSQVYRLNGEPELALQYALKALSISQKTNSFKALNITYSHYELGVVYNELKQYEKARKHLTAFIKEIPVQLDYYEGLSTLGDGYFELALVEKNEGKYDNAILYFQKAQQAFSDFHGPTTLNIALCYKEIAICNLRQNKYDEALKNYQSGITFLIPTFKPRTLFENPDLHQLVPTELIIQLLNDKRDALKRLSIQTMNPEHWKHAFETARLVMDITINMREGYKWDGSKELLSARSVPALYQALDIGLAYQQVTNKKNLIFDLFNLIEQNKAVTLQQAIRNKKINSAINLPHWIIQQEDDLRQTLQFTQEQILLEERKKEIIDSTLLYHLHAKQLKLHESLDSLKLVIQKKYPAYYHISYANNKNYIEELRTKDFFNNTTLLEFFWTDSILYTFTISNKSAQIHVTPINFEINSSIDKVSRLNPKTTIHTFTQAARTLYNQLLAPVLPPGQPVDKLIIIPDGPLGNFPFQLLLEKDPSPASLAAENWRELPYLLKSKTIRYEYSAALLLDKQPHRKTKQFYAGFAPVFGGQALTVSGTDSATLTRAFPNWRAGDALPDLEFNQPEIQDAAALMGGNTYLGNAATEQNFKQYAAETSILHLATHAWADDMDPLYSQIRFAPTPADTAEDGALHAYELYNMHLNAELAVLSACQTGAGRIQRGEGVMSLARAFKYAGCPNIVTSLWNANDETSRDIMRRFFKNLKAGMDKDEGLCRAQRDYLAQATLTDAHPSRWATFVLIGDDTPMGLGPRKWLVALLALGLCALIAYLFFGRHKA